MLLNNSITNLWPTISISSPNLSHVCVYNNNYYSPFPYLLHSLSVNNFKCNNNVRGEIGKRICCRARRRVRYEEEDDDDDGYNEEIAMLEMYSQSARGEAILVTATVDDQEVEVLIFKGYSSCLSYGTSFDPSKSILPQRAIIKFIDRIKGPFNPTNIEYIEKDVSWETFRNRLYSE